MLKTLTEDQRVLLIAAVATTWVWAPETPGQATEYRDLLGLLSRARTIVLNNEVNQIEER